MKNTKGNVIQAIIVIIVGIILAYVAIGLATNSNRYIGTFTGEEGSEYESGFLPDFENGENENTDESEEVACGITVTEPLEGDIVSGAFSLSGFINGCGWTAFEGQAAIVYVFDEDGTEIFADSVPATSDWMTLPVQFSRIVPTSPSGTSGVVLIENIDASGENPLFIDIPVFFN